MLPQRLGTKFRGVLVFDASFVPRPSPLLPKVFQQALKNACQPLVPLIPVVAAGAGVILISKMILREQFRKPAVRWQQPFLLAAREKNVSSMCWIYSPDKHVRIVVVPGLACPWSKNRACSRHCPIRLTENGRLGTSIAGLSAPANTNRSGCLSERLTAPKPPIEMPIMARFGLPTAAGHLPSTSETRSLTT